MGGGRTVAVVAVLELLAVMSVALVKAFAAFASLWWESAWRDGGDDKWLYVAVVSVLLAIR